VSTDILITDRPYKNASDLPHMYDFLAASTAVSAPFTYWRPGNLIWTMCWSSIIDPTQSGRLWESETGELLGFAWFDAPSEVTLQVHPRVRGSGLLEDPMLAWAARQAHQTTLNQPATVALFVCDDDPAYLTLLARHGFERGAWSIVYLECSLASTLLPNRPPEGITVRPVAGEHEYVQRVMVHQEANPPSQFTLEAYQRLRASPGYDPGLDLVAVTSDGMLAAYCLCWFDPRTGAGLFEPVATRPAFQRRGMGKAVMWEGLRRLQARGAQTAVLSTGAAEEAALKLYAAVGFKVARRATLYQKVL